MPKVTLGNNLTEQRYNYIAGLLEGGFRRKKLKTKDVYAKTGIPTRTITERLAHPEMTRLEELYKLCDVAGVKIVFQPLESPE